MRCCPVADSQLILELMFLHIRGSCSLTVLLFFLMLVGTCCLIPENAPEHIPTIIFGLLDKQDRQFI